MHQAHHAAAIRVAVNVRGRVTVRETFTVRVMVRIRVMFRVRVRVRVRVRARNSGNAAACWALQDLLVDSCLNQIPGLSEARSIDPSHTP